MSFHNRYLQMESIVKAAKNAADLDSFVEFMTQSSAYTFFSQETFIIHKIFVSQPLIRMNLWLMLGTQEHRKISPGVRGLCKYYQITEHPGNKEKHAPIIRRYAENLIKCDPKYSLVLAEILEVFNSQKS